MRVGLLWRAEWDGAQSPSQSKLQGVFAAFAELGVDAMPVVYSDDRVEDVRAELLELDGVLVWVNPIEQGFDRSQLDPLLRDVAERGVWVSAHPDVILRMGTKQVLADTQSMSWGTETHVHRSAGQLRARLAEIDGPRVFKQHRGMGGDGVWKVERLGDGELVVQHAAKAAAPERVGLDAFVARCAPYFAGEGRMVEQPYQPRLDEGMTRIYLTHDRVVGFALQFPRGLMPADYVPPTTEKRFLEATAYPDLRLQAEQEWMPELMRILDLDVSRLPVIWDVDVLRGEDGRYVLCEINVSSTFAFPEHAMPAVAAAALERIREWKAAGQGFEPQLPVPETGVLPLDDPATGRAEL
jgi:hypothetical protein